MKKQKAFTLLELTVVLLSVGVLSTLAITHYFSQNERLMDKEALASLKLLQSAQRIYLMDYGVYYPTGSSTSGTDIADINQNLKVLLTEGDPTNKKWDYVTYSGGALGAGTSTAARSGRTWRMSINASNATCTGSCL